MRTMRARLFGTDREEIADLDAWLAHAAPEKGEAQWRDGYSAKEQAKSWLRSGSPAVPEELWAAVAHLAGGADEVYGRPEHRTRLDKFSRARQHDMFACARHEGATTLVIGVEAKACEDYDGTVADRAAAAAPSKKRARCNLLSRALFGRDVIDEETGEILDSRLAAHGYQLWTAAVGTIIEAQEREVPDVVLVVQQFVSDPVSAGDKRNWVKATAVNAAAFEAFAADLERAGAVTRETPFVQPGTRLSVVKVESPIG